MIHLCCLARSTTSWGWPHIVFMPTPEAAHRVESNRSRGESCTSTIWLIQTLQGYFSIRIIMSSVVWVMCWRINKVWTQWKKSLSPTAKHKIYFVIKMCKKKVTAKCRKHTYTHKTTYLNSWRKIIVILKATEDTENTASIVK